MALGETLVRIVLWHPGAAVPDHDRAAAIFALRDCAFELVVVNRMVFDLHGETFFTRHQAGAASHRPALHDAIEFEPQIVMQPPRRVLLNDVSVPLSGDNLTLRLGGDAEPPLAVIGRKSGSHLI